MLAVQTTVVAVVAGADAPPLASVRAANVRVLPAGEGAPVERASRAYEQAGRTNVPYLLHDADPLAWVADAWARRFDGTGAVGELEVAVSETLARWRARSLDLPDYYVVVDAEALPPTRRHWYLGVLGSAAPSRVVTSRGSEPLVDHLAGLRPCPWWPGLDRLLSGIERVLPDRAGLPG